MKTPPDAIQLPDDPELPLELRGKTVIFVGGKPYVEVTGPAMDALTKFSDRDVGDTTRKIRGRSLEAIQPWSHSTEIRGGLYLGKASGGEDFAVHNKHGTVPSIFTDEHGHSVARSFLQIAGSQDRKLVFLYRTPQGGGNSLGLIRVGPERGSDNAGRPLFGAHVAIVPDEMNPFELLITMYQEDCKPMGSPPLGKVLSATDKIKQMATCNSPNPDRKNAIMATLIFGENAYLLQEDMALMASDPKLARLIPIMGIVYDSRGLEYLAQYRQPGVYTFAGKDPVSRLNTHECVEFSQRVEHAFKGRDPHFEILFRTVPEPQKRLEILDRYLSGTLEADSSKDPQIQEWLDALQ